MPDEQPRRIYSTLQSKTILSETVLTFTTALKCWCWNVFRSDLVSLMENSF